MPVSHMMVLNSFLSQNKSQIIQSVLNFQFQYFFSPHSFEGRSSDKENDKDPERLVSTICNEFNSHEIVEMLAGCCAGKKNKMREDTRPRPGAV